jgi:hypothetical protein
MQEYNWTNLAQDNVPWRDFMNRVAALSVSSKARKFFTN